MLTHSKCLYAAPFLLILATQPALHAQDAPAIKVSEEATNAVKKADLSKEPAAAPPSPIAVKAPTPVLGTADTTTLATWNGGQLTNTETSSILATRRPAGAANLSPEQFDTAGRTAQTDVVKQLALEKILLSKARAAGVDESHPAVARALATQEEALLNRLYFQDQVAPQLNQLTEKVAQEYYNDNIDRLFTTPATTNIRAVHISTYEQVTTEEGDTLAGLAERISGSKTAATRIVEGKAPYFARGTSPEVDDKVLSSPLEQGEVLYVPMDDDAVSSAGKFASALRAKLVSGQKIDKVVAETRDEDFTVSVTQPLDLDNSASLYDSLSEAARQLGTTTVSQVIKTPSGFNILVMEDATTTKTTGFDEVKAELVQRVSTDESQRKETIERTREMVFNKLFSKYNVEINRPVVGRSNYLGTDPLSTNTMIAKVDDLTYTLEDFLSDLRMTGKDWGQLTEEERLEVVRVAPKLSSYVIAKEARSIGIQNSEAFKTAISGVAESQIVAQYKKQTNDPAKNRVTEAMLREYYETNLDKYTSAAQVTLRELSKRINMTLAPAAKAEQIDKARQSLNEIRGRINSQEDFAQLARRESEAISTRSKGGLIGTVAETFRGEAFKNQVRQLKPGEVSQPFLYGSEVMIIRIDDRTAPTAQAFEEVRRQLMQDYAATEPRKRAQQETADILKEAEFKITF